MLHTIFSYANRVNKAGAGKKVLFATVPFDGHVNPLTGLAVHLKNLGYDVRWYTSNYYHDKLKKLQIPHYPLVKAMDVRAADVDILFPERKNYKTLVSKLNFDITNVFIDRSTEYYADVVDIYRSFAFDMVVADFAFSAIPFIREKMNIPVVMVNAVPLNQTSKDLPPAGLGLTPSYSFFGKMKQATLRLFADKVLFKKSNKALAQLCKRHRLSYNGENVFDFLLSRATLVLQSGTPSFEYFRSDMSDNIRFVGPMLPYTQPNPTTTWFDDRLNKYSKVILVTQGTVEKDVEKLLVPTLEAFKGTDVLVVATTGGGQKDEFRERYPQENLIIEEFIPFAEVMPYADVYVTNGGFGGVLLGIENELPLVVAGVHEGKNEINARVGYFKLGVNLKTETPTPEQLKTAVMEAISDPVYKINVVNLASEFAEYDAKNICASYINQLLQTEPAVIKSAQEEEILF